MSSPLPLAPSRRLTSPSLARLERLTIVGAGVGLLAYAIVGLIPSLLYGGGAGVQVASQLFGPGYAPSMAVNAFVVFCILSAGTVVAALFAALGAVAGASVGVLASASER